MKDSREERVLRVLSGEDRRLSAAMLRGALALAEPLYAALMRARNAAYDRGVKKIRHLPRPTVSVGNITTGGTGKTPVVRWLAEQFIARGLRPAVLLRGYRGNVTGGSDEQRMLTAMLGRRAAVVADPDRIAGAMSAMSQLPQPDLFLLDDGFQHRRAARDFDLVLINAAQPFGHGHVIPRGLLREPLRGLSRADAIVLTHADCRTHRLDEIEQVIRRHSSAPVFLADHVHVGVRQAADENLLPLDELTRRRFFLFCGIGNPASFFDQFQCYAQRRAGCRAFPDHHAYTAQDLRDLSSEALRAGAEMLLTTEKDWVKIEQFVSPDTLAVMRTQLEVRFRGESGDTLMAQIMSHLTAARPAWSPAAAGAVRPDGAAPA